VNLGIYLSSLTFVIFLDAMLRSALVLVKIIRNKLSFSPLEAAMMLNPAKMRYQPRA
jgi:hypothetical protein